MPEITSNELLGCLAEPAAYPWPVDRVHRLDTHISYLFFAGDRVVKIKRPVDYGFVDLTELASRKRACEDEVRLNRRLTDDIYIAAEPIVRTSSGVSIGGHGKPVEWATVMRRFPIDATLDHLLPNQAAPANLSALLAERLIPFHRSIPDCAADPAVEAAAAERILRENLDQIAAIGSDAIFPLEFERIRTLVTGMLEARPEMIRQRADAGYIREGHGDLKCEHVLLDPPGSLQIFDCVEFSREIRCADIASDLAFLVLDLRRLGASPIANDLIARYRAAGIELPDLHLGLYSLHRGLVKVKTVALAIPGAAVLVADAHRRDVAEWLHETFRAGFRLDRCVVAMTGYSGSGKSAVARDIVRLTGASLFSTDEVRSERFADDPDRYQPEARQAVYREVLARAATELERGHSVVLDAAFLGGQEREMVSQLAETTGVPLIFVNVVASDDTMTRRIEARSRGDSPSFDSEASIDVLQSQQHAAKAEIPEGADWVTIDNSTDTPPSLDPLIEQLDPRGLLRSRLD
ncbi:MAG: AAA family ATPase [Thermomicrobiales bacterium]